MGVGPQEHFDIMDKTLNKWNFSGQKHTFKRKKFGFRAKCERLGLQIAIQKMKISSTSKT
jgi:hypothetical protein